MPWTFAHPAAILPLRSLCPRWLSLPGLVLGAMAPDLSYYVGMHGKYAGFCHTAPGIFTVCLPACLLLLALLLRFSRPLTVLLPEPHRGIVRGQLRQPARALWVSLVVAVVSILIGTGTHVLWDSFTHPNLWGSSLLPWLNRPVFGGLDRQFVVATLLQHLSTAVGVVALTAVYWRALDARRDTAPPPRHARRTLVLLACVAIAVAAGALSAHALTAAAQPAYFSRLLVRTVVWSTSCFTVLFVAASALWWRRHGDA